MKQEFTEEIKRVIGDHVTDVHTALPGKIDSFDAEKCEASVLPYGKFKKPDGSLMDFPKLNEVPVFFPQGSWRNASIVFPIKKGDECLLLISEQALDVWRDSGAESKTDLRFDLSNAICLPGLFSKPPRTLQDVDSKDAMIIDIQYRKDDNGDGQKDDTLQKEQRVTMSPDGIKLEASFDIDTAKTTTLVEMKKKSVSIDTDNGVLNINTRGTGIEGTTLDITSDSINVECNSLTIETGTMDITSGSISSKSSALAIESGTLSVESEITVTGNSTINGDVTMSGTFTLDGIILNTHKHPYTWTDPAGEDDTGEPING